jgi:hypothetical protein
MVRDQVEATSGILKALGATCRDDARRQLLLANPGLGLNGIDFVEFKQPAASVNLLRVHFLYPLPPDLYKLATDNFPTIRIQGGARIVGITPSAPTQDPTDASVLDIPVSTQGDFSTYWLSVGWVHVPADDSWTYTIAGIDRQFSVAPINFRPGCPIDFDCALAPPLAPPSPPAPALGYLAKDYASFRQLLLDLVTQRNPTWLETNPADLGITLLELLAYEGDYLSYFQDAVANESFLDTVRKRISAKRHARLVDYHMHDGRNAWTHVYFAVSSSGTAAKGTLPPGQQLLTRVEVPLRNQSSPPPVVIDPTSTLLDFDTDPALAAVKVFETAATVRLDLLNNELRLHTWGNAECCLPPGTTVCHVFAIQPGGVGGTAVLPDLEPDDWLLLEEVKSPVTGALADADPTHRQVVRITRVEVVTDELFDAALDPAGNLQLRIAAPLGAPAVAAGAAGAPNGTYTIVVTFTRATAESNASPASAPITVANQNIDVSGIATSPDPRVTGRNIYGFKSGVSSAYQLIGTLNDNSTTTFAVATDQPSWTTAVGSTTGLQVMEVSWDPSDALTFALCLGTTLPDGSVATGLSVARGNIALADHGRSVSDVVVLDTPVSDTEHYKLVLKRAPLAFQSQAAVARIVSIVQVQVAGNILTITSGQILTDLLVPGLQVMFSGVRTAAFLNGQTTTVLSVSGSTFTGSLKLADYGPASDSGTAAVLQLGGERTDLTSGVRSVTPAVQLMVTDEAGASELWSPVPDLLESNEFNNDFVVDVDDDGQGILRFGDDGYGRPISGAASIAAYYRVGNGREGNIGRDALAHVVVPAPPPPTQPTILSVRNPLPAQDGTDPETIEQVRQYAPAAFHAVQYRAVTEPDYVAAALTVDGVASTVAQFRWTGSWYTAFLGIRPSDPADVVTLPGGRTSLDPAFAVAVTEALSKFKLAGYDIEVRSAEYVPLSIEVHICVSSDHFRADVVQAVLTALSNGVQPDGTPGFFNPAKFAFGQPVYLSRLYAAIDAVEGVDSAEVMVFQRYGRLAQGEVQAGVILMGPWEIARLDNDVNRKENGVLIIGADGGK